MIEMKISPADDCTWLNEDCTLMIDGDTPKEAEVAAGKINNHGRMAEELKSKTDMLALVVEEKSRMAEEIAELRSFAKKVSGLHIETFHFEAQGGYEDCFEYVCTDIVNDAKELLAKLNQEGEE